jgi:hypothetical protein
MQILLTAISLFLTVQAHRQAPQGRGPRTLLMPIYEETEAQKADSRCDRDFLCKRARARGVKASEFYAE